MKSLVLLLLTVSAFTDTLDAQDLSRLNSLRERAEHGDDKAQSELGFMYEAGVGGAERDYGEALKWFRRAAEQGNSGARLSLGTMYAKGIGVEQDYSEAARWYGCPKPSGSILAGCTAISYTDLPVGAQALLKKMRCRVGPGSSYDYGSAVDLNADGSPEYQFCCDYAAHGPCGSVLIGRIGSKWRILGRLLGYEPPCGLVVVLEAQRRGFHDICLPNECSSSSSKVCKPTILGFTQNGYVALGPSPEAAETKPQR